MALPFAAGVLAFLAVVLLWMGLRGRMVTRHPVCRRCHFDLVGSAGAARCPECGADLSRKRAIRQGLRKRRGWAVALGLLTLLMFLGVSGLVVLPFVSKVDLNEYKPTWLLVEEAKSSLVSNKAAVRELMARRAAGTIVASTYRDLVAHALARQADPGLGWSGEWGDLIEDASIRGDATPQQMQRFLKQSAHVETTFRGHAKGNQGLPYTVLVEVVRGTSNPRLDLLVPRAEVMLEGEGAEPIRRGGEHGGAITVSLWNGEPQGTASSIWFGREGVPAGRYTAKVRIPIVLSGYGEQVELLSEVRGAVEVLRPGGSTVKLLASSATFEKPRAAATLSLLPRQPSNRYPGPGTVRELYLTVGLSAREYDSAFRCTGYSMGLDGTEREWPLGTMVIRKGVSTGVAIGEVPGDFAPRRMRVVLRADPSAAERNVEITEIWGGELVIGDVEIAETTGGVPVPRSPR